MDAQNQAAMPAEVSEAKAAFDWRQISCWRLQPQAMSAIEMKGARRTTTSREPSAQPLKPNRRLGLVPSSKWSQCSGPTALLYSSRPGRPATSSWHTQS